jgi:hypothetical protein
MTSSEDIRSLKGLEWMRRRPEMYAPEGISVASIAGRLASDALLLGAKHVRIDTVEGWGLVSAETDWLTVPVRAPVPVAELFQRLVIFDEGGPNAARAEAWVGAYCFAAYAVTDHERLQVVGEMPMPRAVEDALLPSGYVRTVALFVPSSEQSAAPDRADNSQPAER